MNELDVIMGHPVKAIDELVAEARAIDARLKEVENMPELESPLSLPSWFYEEDPKEEYCPNCEGTGSVAHRCTCGTLPSNPAYSRCESCFRQVDWRSCPECGGKGILTIK